MFLSVCQLRETKTFQNWFNNKEYNSIYVQSVVCVLQALCTLLFQTTKSILTITLDFSFLLSFYVYLGWKLQGRAVEESNVDGYPF